MELPAFLSKQSSEISPHRTSPNSKNPIYQKKTKATRNPSELRVVAHADDDGGAVLGPHRSNSRGSIDACPAGEEAA